MNAIAQDANVEQAQKTFLEMMPDIEKIAACAFRELDPDAREEALAETFAQCWQNHLHCCQEEKDPGPSSMAYYAVLAAKGFIPTESLATFGDYDSLLGQHPDRVLIPGVEISSGSLGHGLPVAVGVANALQAKGLEAPRVFCLVGDAELDEGSNHEAICVAARLHLNRLNIIVIDNQSASHGWPGGIAARFAVEGKACGPLKDAVEIDIALLGHQHDLEFIGPGERFRTFELDDGESVFGESRRFEGELFFS